MIHQTCNIYAASASHWLQPCNNSSTIPQPLSLAILKICHHSHVHNEDSQLAAHTFQTPTPVAGHREQCIDLETCQHGLTGQVLTNSSRVCLRQSHISSHDIELHHGSHIAAAFRSICDIAGDSIHVGDAAGNDR